ncbi:hypothetical protein BDW74DRAFT_157982 [Aspergillus multicolor]|uniref:CCCH zinc finger protein n=1 Tax=Aspergillus multicolor TaxID=41759 RepID=UPI003CCDA699
MNPQGFSFPPPPPPPPTQQNQPQQQYPHNNGYTQYGQNQHGQRGGRGGGGGQFRGRGRGYGNRGGGRGGHFMNSDANRSGGYTAAAGGYAPMTYLGYPTQHLPNHQAVPQFTQPPSQNYSGTVTGNSFASTSQYPQATAHGTPYQHQQSYGTPYAAPTTQQTPAYPPAHPTQHATPSLQLTMMGPPIRWGFENTGNSGSFSGPQRPNQRGPRQKNAHNHHNSPGKHANKRDHASAFGKPHSTAPRVPAPPPVPSFGNPLPSKPPTPADTARKSKKKKRKHNQLGLTPKTEDHESSEEEDDADEETRLAAGSAGAAAALQVTYRGRTSNLQSPVDIAAWIAERKKRFPTQAKIEEKKKALEEAKKASKAKQEAQRQQREARKLATARSKKEHEKKEQPRDIVDPADAAAKAKLKAEKLRRKLLKEEKRIAQAEADAERARKREEPQEGSTPTANQPDNQISAVHGEQADDDLDSVTSEDSDWTSSSGSDLSSSESDESDDDDASPPDQATSRREGPERVAPPARDEKKRVCRHFARNGRCPRGKTCKFVHEKPERGVKTKPIENKGRKGLLEALLDRQKEHENHKLMETIIWLGENGLLDEPAAQ